MKNSVYPVCIGILTYNSMSHIRQCLESVLNQTYPNIDLIIMDNASTDQTSELIKREFPNVPFTIHSENLGFSSAHNHALRQSDAEYYMPLNPDLVLEVNYVEEMVKAMEFSHEVGGVSGKLLFMTADGEKSDQIYTTGHLLTRSRAPANRGYKQQDDGQFGNLEMIFAANGAAPLYRREMLNNISLGNEFFCEDFFMYGEDHDLGWRAQLQGWKCMYAPSAVGYHVGFGSGAIREFNIQSQFTRNRYLTLIRNDQISHFIIDLPFIFAYEVIWQAYTLFRSPRRILAHWRGILHSIGAFGKTYQARKKIQERRQVDSRYIRSYFVSKLW